MDIALIKQQLISFLQYLRVEKNMSQHTERAYENDLKQLIDFWQKNYTIENVTFPFHLIVERFLVTLYHKKISKSSIARKISSLQSFIRYLKSNNIAAKVVLTRPHIDKKLPTYLTLDEVSYLLDQIKPHELPTKHPYRDKAIFELLYATGIRCSELVNIKLQDINVQEKTVRIMGKGNKERLVLFGAKAQISLQNYIQTERPAPVDLQERLFLNFRNQPLTARSIQRICHMFQQFLKTDKKITPHKLRHSFATHLLHQGVDLRLLQELLGHATLTSTEKYTHISSKQLSEMCDNLHPFNNLTKITE